MNSVSDVFVGGARTQVNVIWELSVESNDDNRSTYINSVTVYPTEAFLAFISQNGLSFEDAANERDAPSKDHNSRETPMFAASIARWASR